MTRHNVWLKDDSHKSRVRECGIALGPPSNPRHFRSSREGWRVKARRLGVFWFRVDGGVILLGATMASDSNNLDDVPMSIRQNLTQSSPSFSIVTDTNSPEGIHQTQKHRK